MGKFKRFVFELFTYKGRIGNGRFILNGIAIWTPVFMITGPLDAFNLYPRLPEFVDALVMLYVFAWMIIGIPLTIFNCAKRLHDMNQPGTWWLAGFIPLGNLILLAFLLLSPGTDGPNKYGEALKW